MSSPGAPSGRVSSTADAPGTTTAATATSAVTGAVRAEDPNHGFRPSSTVSGPGTYRANFRRFSASELMAAGLRGLSTRST